MSNLVKLAKENYIEKQAFLSQIGQGIRQIGSKGMQKGIGLLGGIKNWFVPSVPELRQFESYMHSPIRDWLKRDISTFVHPETGETHYLHGLLAQNFGLRYGKGAQHNLMMEALRNRTDLLTQLNNKKRSLTGRVYDFFAGPLTREKIMQQYAKERDFANRMGASTSSFNALKNLGGSNFRDTLGNIRRFGRDNWVTGVSYGFPALAGYDVLKHRDPSMSLPEQMGDVLGSTAGGVVTFPLGIIGGTIGATTGGSMGKFMGKQIGKLTGSTPKVPNTFVGYNPPNAVLKSDNYNNPYNIYNSFNR